MSDFTTIDGDEYENLDSISKYLETCPEELIKIEFTSEQFMEFKRVILQDKIYPFAKQGYVPSPLNLIKIKDMITHSWPRLETLLELEPEHVDFLVNFECNNNISENNLLNKVDLYFGDVPYKEYGGFDTVISYLKYIIQLSRMKIMRTQKACNYFNGYGYYKDFFQIETYSSGRPITEMPFIINYQATKSETSIYKQVVRYAFGMTHGCYTDKKDESDTKEYKGTWYYSEPDSPFLLDLGIFRTYRNKYHAFTSLNEEINTEDIAKIFPEDWQMELYRACLEFDQHHGIDYYKNSNVPLHHESSFMRFYVRYFLGCIPGFLFDEIPEINQIFIRNLFRRFFIDGEILEWRDQILNPNELTSTWKSTGETYHLDLLYADEDIFDQPLALIAKYLNIDCLILTHMVGKTRKVEEILDTRDRIISYSSFVKL